jgi:glyoxylase-like metal-dependent hydrolase (beta-lactamase superfamily II)
MPLPFALDHINLWLLRTTTDDARRLRLSAIRRPRAVGRHFATTLDRAPIRRIIATHCHPDHVGNARGFAALRRAPSHDRDEYLTAHTRARRLGGHTMRATVESLPPSRNGGPTRGSLEAGVIRYRRGVPELPESFVRLHDGSTRRAAARTWRVIQGFGHSPEHCVALFGERGVLIAGDMLLPKISTNVSVTPMEPDGDPLALFLESLSVLEALPPDTLVLPSHGLPFRGIALRVAQLRAHHAARLGDLEDAIAAARSPSTAASVVPVLFPPRARRPSAVLRDGRSDRASQPSLHTGPARASGRLRRCCALHRLAPRSDDPTSPLPPKEPEIMSSTAKTAAQSPSRKRRTTPSRCRLAAHCARRAPR